MNLPTCISSNRKIRYMVCFVILITLSVLFFIISVCAGSVQIPLSDIWRQFRGEQDELYAAILFQSGCRAPSDAGASSGNNDDLVVFSHHDFPPEKIDLIRVNRMAERLSILIAGLWKSTVINLRKFLRRLASLFSQPMPISA